MSAVMEPTVADQSALDALVGLLDLESIEVNIFRGNSPDENRQRVFGGQVAGQALVAAARTIPEPGRLVHSLHAYFLRPGDPSRPVEFHVERMRDGRGFSVRRVLAHQHGKVTFAMSASFHLTEAAPIRHTTMAPTVPAPESLPNLRHLMAPQLEQVPPMEKAIHDG